MIHKKMNKKGNAIVISLLTLLFVILVMVSVVGIYINKFYSVRNLNDYYDKKIIEQVEKNKNSK